jgi:PD-(D/E)XK nuclease superfamily
VTSATLDIAALQRDIERYETLYPIGELSNASPKLSESSARTELKIDELRAISESAVLVHEEMKAEAEHLLGRLRDDWPQNPLISRASLFSPLGLNRKELVWTKAIAWVLSSGPRSSALRQHAHRVFVGTLLGKEISATESLRWTAEAEHQVFIEERPCRIDVYLEGPINDVKHRIGVEAKVDATESSGQVLKYQKALAARIPRGEVVMVLLTPNGRSASSGRDVLAISYEQFLDCMLPVLRDHPNDEAAPFVHLLLADMARELTRKGGMHHGTQYPELSMRLIKLAQQLLGTEEAVK